MLDIKVCDSISSLVEKLATLGIKVEEVDKDLFKQLVGFAGQSEDYIKFTLERLFHHLEEKHSEIRFGAFLVVDALFKRSHYFREVLLDDFHTFLELTVESDPSKLLPPPLTVAKRLKQKVLQSVHKWYSRFGKDHKRLALSYNFLKNSLKVDFQDALTRNARELEAVRAEEERQRKVNEKKVKGVEQEVEEHQDEISRVVTEMGNCFSLLVPKPDEAFSGFGEGHGKSGSSEEEEDEGVDVNLREHGYHSIGAVSIQVVNEDLKNIKETEDNVAIIQNLKDFHALLKNRYLPMIKKWIAIASKANEQTLFRKVLDMKNLIEKEINRFNRLQVTKSSDSEDDDSDDFEEVPEKEGFEMEAHSSPVASSEPLPGPSRAKPSSSIHGWSLVDIRKEDADDPTTLAATLKKINEEKLLKSKRKHNSSDSDGKNTSSGSDTPTKASDQEASRKQKLLKIAPKVPYDIDLYHWEDRDLKAPSFEIVETDGHKFWTPAQDRAGEVIDDPNGVASLRTRVIEFSGQFEPVKWSCRAPLPSGSLCPRRDRIKCPLHGKIIARDEAGNPTNPEDILALEKAKEEEEKSKPPEWQDPVFLKEIEAATGMDLTIRPPKKGKKKKQTFTEMYPGLTDIDKKRNTPRSRLEKKIFNKSAMRRVADTMDELSEKKYQDKFGDQWSYAMNND